jgi:acyl-coenzyme A synthetase/AMP-(fatty) acid ligase
MPDDFASHFWPTARPLDEDVALGEEPKSWRDLLRSAATLATVIDRLGATNVMLACRDRYHVAAGLLASWSNGGIGVLPSNLRVETVLSQARTAAADLVLSDDGEVGEGIRTLLVNQPPIGRGPTDFPGSLPVGRHLVTVFTSGSTGAPVLCHKTAGQLLGEAVFVSRFFRLDRQARVLALAPPHHLYGLLFGVLAPLLGQGSFVRSAPLLPDSIATSARRHSANVLCAVPAHLAGFSALAAEDLPSIERVICSGGRLDASTGRMLRDRFPFSVTEVFGSSETGGIAYRRAENTPAWLPFEGVSVATDSMGRLLLDSPFLPPNGPRPLSSNDLVAVNPDGTFQHLGRCDDIIKIAGERVSIAEVEDRIRGVAGIADVAVIKIPAPAPRQWELWAAVVAPGLTESSLRRVLFTALDGVAMPRRFRFATKLPREESGKLVQERLRALFEVAEEDRDQRAPPGEDMVSMTSRRDQP